jgi:hypothetical protein
MNEPTVLDYMKALLTPWKGKPPAIPPSEQPAVGEAVRPSGIEPAAAGETAVQIPAAAARGKVALPWRATAGLLAAFIAQIFLTASKANAKFAITLYLIALILFVLAALEREWALAEMDDEGTADPFPLTVRRNLMFASMPLLLAAFLAFGDAATHANHFNELNLILWLAGTAALAASIYLPARSRAEAFSRVMDFFRKPEWRLRITRSSLVLIAAVTLVVFFRFYRLEQVPKEMFSDQAEKLYDVMDVLLGKTPVYFERNTGREALQFYLTALIAIIFNTKISFISLKIGTALAGLLTLPYIYLLGKQVGGQTVGLLAFVLAGIAYWPNVISRVGLRFPFYPLFAAPTLFYLIRGLRFRRRNDFIWSGIALGIGLHGYSPIRFLPVAIVAVVGVYLLHRHSRGNRIQTVWALIALAAVALALFIPLLRYAIENPDMFGFRMLTRMGTIERPYPGPVGLIFLNNLWKSLVMFFYDNGNVWVNSIPGRPALDTITAVLFFTGCALIFLRYIRRRHWLDLIMLLLVPLLMMTSILSLAFPDENPSLNRSGAAIIPVFVITAFGLDAIIRTFLSRAATRGAKTSIVVLAAALLLISMASNYQLVFVKYSQQYDLGAWNTSEIGEVIRDFAGAQGSLDTAYVIPYPHWVDTRLVGINAGYPGKDYALWADQLETTLAESRAKLFIFHPADGETANKLEMVYPSGVLYRYQANLAGKDFMMYFVPPAQP